MHDELKRLEQENVTLKAQQMEAEAALLGQEELVAELRAALAEAEQRLEAAPRADRAVQV
jgi:hypothetical protein